MDFSFWYTFRPQKSDHATLFFLGSHGEWRSHFILSWSKAKLCDDAETFHKRRQRGYLLACARRKQYRQTHRTLKHQCGYFLTNSRRFISNDYQITSVRSEVLNHARQTKRNCIDRTEQVWKFCTTQIKRHARNLIFISLPFLLVSCYGTARTFVHNILYRYRVSRHTKLQHTT